MAVGNFCKYPPSPPAIAKELWEVQTSIFSKSLSITEEISMISEPFKSKMEINNEDRVDLICCLEELLTLSSISMMRGAKKVHLNLTKQLFLHSFQSIQTSLHSAKLLNGDRVKSAKFTKSQTCHKCESFLSDKSWLFQATMNSECYWIEVPFPMILILHFCKVYVINLLQFKSLFVWSLASACVIFSIKELAAPFFAQLC